MNSDSTVYVGFWPRFAATLIDTLVVSLIILPLLLWMYGWGYFDIGKNANFNEIMDLVRTGDLAAVSEMAQAGNYASTSSGPADVWISNGLPILVILAFWIASQATPGKMLFSAHIVDAKTGGKPVLWQWILRYIGYFISLLPFGLGFISIALDSRKQGWHDKIAGTVVVRPAPPRPVSTPPPLPDAR